MKEEFLQNAYSALNPHCRTLVLGLAIVYIALVVYQKAKHVWPSSSRERKKKAIDDYLSEAKRFEESNAGSADKVLNGHMRELRAFEAFRDASGIRCKPEKRQKLIELYQESGDEWSWSKIASASQYLIMQDGEIRYQVGIWDRLFDLFFHFISIVSIVAMVGILFRYGSATEPKQVVGVVSSILVIGVIAWSSFWMMLPLGRAARLRKEQGIPYASKSAMGENEASDEVEKISE